MTTNGSTAGTGRGGRQASALAATGGSAVRAKAGLPVPALVVQAGEATAERFLEFFVLTLRNAHTRKAYAHAVGTFLHWAQAQGVRVLEDVQPVHVAAYVEQLGAERSVATVKQHLAAIRGAFAWLVTGGRLGANPAADVRGPASASSTGKTPVLYEDDARTLLDAIDTGSQVGLRDRALISVMLYSFARVSAAVKMRVKDYEVVGRRASVVLHEKRGQFRRVPAHHKLADALDEYIDLVDIRDDRDGPLFRATDNQARSNVTERPLTRQGALYIVKRRARAAGLPPEAVSCHTFRATGITDFMGNGGTLEVAASIAGHASTRTTQLYNRSTDRVTLQEIERIRI